MAPVCGCLHIALVLWLPCCIVSLILLHVLLSMLLHVDAWWTSCVHNLNFSVLLWSLFVISLSAICDCHWSSARHMMCKNNPCCQVVSMQRYTHYWCMWITWSKQCRAWHLHWFWSNRNFRWINIHSLHCFIFLTCHWWRFVTKR